MEEAMFGKRCSLCGGKLNSNGICTECGLDNNKSDKNYRINQSECDHEPLTHVHHGKNEKPEKQPKPNTPRQSWQGSTTTYSGNTGSTGRKKSGKNKKPGRIISKIIAVIVIFNVFFGIFQPLVSDILDDVISGYQENTEDYTRSDPYEYVTKELPAGVYDLILVSGEGSVDVDIYTEYGESMETKNLYLGENCTDGKEYKNLVLPKNAQITLDDNMELRLTPSEHISTTDYYEYYNY